MTQQPRTDRTKDRIIADQARDCIDALEAIASRATRAYAEAKPPSRRPDHQPKGKGPTDPTGETAMEILATLEQVQSSLQDIKHACYATAGRLSDWAPARRWDNGTRRCGMTGCAREHHAQGLCQTHYRRWQRADERERGAS